MFTREDLINGPKIYQSRRRKLTSAEMNNTATLQSIFSEYGAEGWAFYNFDESSDVITFNYVGRVIEYQVHLLSTIGLINKFNELGSQFQLFLGAVNRNAIFAYIGYDGSAVSYSTLNLEEIPEDGIRQAFEAHGQLGWQFIAEYRERPIFGYANGPVTQFVSPVHPDIDPRLQEELDALGDYGWQYIGNMPSIEHAVFALGSHPVAFSFDRIGNPQTDSEAYFNQKGKESWKYVGSGFRVNLFMK